MSDDRLQLLVKYRVSEAEETLREAELLLKQSGFRGSINRSYYGMFYALLGLLATRGLGRSKHSAVISLFDLLSKREFFPRSYLAAYIGLLMSDRLMTMGKC